MKLSSKELLEIAEGYRTIAMVIKGKSDVETYINPTKGIKFMLQITTENEISGRFCTYMSILKKMGWNIDKTRIIYKAYK